MDEKIMTIKQVCDLIKKSNGLSYRKFTNSQKISFAYDYWTLSPEDITDLYNYLAEHRSRQSANLASVIGSFIDNQGINPIRKFDANFYERDLNNILSATDKIKNNGNWLSKYNLEREFTDTSFHDRHVRYGQILSDGSIFQIDKKRANNILGILIDSNIPTAKSIVKGSFPYYANNDMDTYIKSFKKTK